MYAKLTIPTNGRIAYGKRNCYIVKEFTEKRYD